MISTPVDSHSVTLLTSELKELKEQLARAEAQGKVFRDPGVRKYLERKIRELDAELLVLGRRLPTAPR
jgi:hypothetical protein